MSRGSRAALDKRIAEVRERAAALAEQERSRTPVTSPAVERATLRLLGVQGLDRGGDPLAGAVVDHLAEAGPGELAGGVALPLAAAAAARALNAQEAALEVAGGEIDLADERQFLQHPDRLASAEAMLRSWTEEAFARVDDNKTARREVNDALGLPEEPWLGARVGAFQIDAAAEEARGLVAAGADALIVRVPRGRELLVGAGIAGDQRQPSELDPPPAGSQRGLAAIRALLDELAAERGASVLLATVTEGLAAPEQAVVAAFERIDLVIADPFDEIARGVDPRRAFTDHAAALRLLSRSGTTLVLGPGILLAGPELARGESLAGSTRIGRSVAAQAVSGAWAAAMGMANEHIVLQAPFEAPADAAAALLLLAEVTVRRRLHPDHGLAISEPADAGPDRWRLGLPLSLLAANGARLITLQAPLGDYPTGAGEARSAVELARTLAPALATHDPSGGLPLSDEVIDAALHLTQVAVETLDIALRDGWGSLVGSGNPQETGELMGMGQAGLVPTRMYAGPLGPGAGDEGGE